MWYMTEDRELLQESLREFVEKEVKPFVPNMENGEFPTHLCKRMGELGLVELSVTDEEQGIKPDYVSFAMTLEEIAKENLTLGVILGILGTATGGAILEYGTPEQIEKWGRPTVAGDLISAYSVTEPAGVFNYPEHQTKAVLDGDEWVINGSKIFCTNAGQADYYLVVAGTSQFDPTTLGGMTFFIVPKDAPGFQVGTIETKLGWNGSSTGQIFFKDCRVPKENVLGEIGQALPSLFKFIPLDFAIFGAMTLGAAQGVWQKTREYLSERKQGGVSLWDANQVIRSSMARMWAEIECFRGAVYQCFEMLDKGLEASRQGIALKFMGADLLESVSSKCVELHGGTGVVVETGIERYYRDAKVTGIGSGATTFLIDMLSQQI